MKPPCKHTIIFDCAETFNLIHFKLLDLALDSKRGQSRGRGPPYVGPLPQREPPSPAPSRRTHFDTLERRPSYSKNMYRTTSTADISEYKMNDTGAIKLQTVSNLILLIASLIMISVGTYNEYL